MKIGEARTEIRKLCEMADRLPRRSLPLDEQESAAYADIMADLLVVMARHVHSSRSGAWRTSAGSSEHADVDRQIREITEMVNDPRNAGAVRLAHERGFRWMKTGD